MSSWWKTAKDILKGKARGSKLIILAIFLAGIALTTHLYTGDYTYASSFYILSIIAFVRGINLYEEEAHQELKKKYNVRRNERTEKGNVERRTKEEKEEID